METQLRPYSLGEILDRTAQLYRSNFLVFAGIFSIYAGVALALNLLQIGLGVLLKSAPLKLSWAILATAGVEWLLLVLLLGAAIAAVSRAAAWAHLGEPATIRTAYASTLPRFRRYLWLMMITSFVAWIPMVIIYGSYMGFILLYVRPKGLLAHPNAAANAHATVILGVVSIAFFLLVLPAFVWGIVMTLRYALALPACVVEGLKAGKAIRRSIELSKGARGRIFILFLLIGVIKVGLMLVSQAFFFAAIFKNHGEVAPWVTACSQVVAFFTNSFLGPIGATGITLFYYDQRVRKEGFDIEWMMQSAGLVAPPLASESADATPTSEPA
jgi:uncharacterized membrane protein (DUF485 family)